MPVTVATTSFLLRSFRSNPRHRDSASLIKFNLRSRETGDDDGSDGEEDTSPDTNSDSEEDRTTITVRSPPASTGSAYAPTASQSQPGSIMSSSHSASGSSTPGSGNSGEEGGGNGGLTIDFGTESGSTTTSATTTAPSRTLPFFSQFSGSTFTASNGTVVPVDPTSSSSPAIPNVPTQGTGSLRLSNAAIVGITLGFITLATLIILTILKICKRRRRASQMPRGFVPSTFLADSHQPNPNLAYAHAHGGAVHPQMAQHHHLQLQQQDQHQQQQPEQQPYRAPEFPIAALGGNGTTTTGSFTTNTVDYSPPPGGRALSLSPFSALRISSPSPLSSGTNTGSAPSAPPGLGRRESGGGFGFSHYFRSAGRRASRGTRSSQSSHGKAATTYSSTGSHGGKDLSGGEKAYPEADPLYLAMPALVPPSPNGPTSFSDVNGNANPNSNGNGNTTSAPAMSSTHTSVSPTSNNRGGGFDGGQQRRDYGDGAEEHYYTGQSPSHEGVYDGRGDSQRDPPPSYGQAF